MSSNMRDPVIQAIVAARVSLLFDDPWYGNIATRCEIIEDANVDGLTITYRQMLYRRDYIAALNPPELIEAIRKAVDQRVDCLNCAPSDDDDAKQRN